MPRELRSSGIQIADALGAQADRPRGAGPQRLVAPAARRRPEQANRHERLADELVHIDVKRARQDRQRAPPRQWRPAQPLHRLGACARLRRCCPPTAPSRTPTHANARRVPGRAGGCMARSRGGSSKELPIASWRSRGRVERRPQGSDGRAYVCQRWTAASGGPRTVPSATRSRGVACPGSGRSACWSPDGLVRRRAGRASSGCACCRPLGLAAALSRVGAAQLARRVLWCPFELGGVAATASAVWRSRARWTRSPSV